MVAAKPETKVTSRRPTYLVELPKGTRWPNMHEWVFAVFALITFRILDMIATNESLLENASFMQLTQTLVGGGVIACAAWLWTSNKSKETEDKVREEKRPAPLPAGQVGDVDLHAQGDVNVSSEGRQS